MMNKYVKEIIEKLDKSNIFDRNLEAWVLIEYPRWFEKIFAKYISKEWFSVFIQQDIFNKWERIWAMPMYINTPLKDIRVLFKFDLCAVIRWFHYKWCESRWDGTVMSMNLWSFEFPFKLDEDPFYWSEDRAKYILDIMSNLDD